MPRIFPTAVQGEIDKQFAGEPMRILEVEWSDGNWVAYADRRLNDEDYPYPLIIDMADFDSTTIITGSSDSQSGTVVLDDTDGSITQILDSIDTHLRPCRVYYTFQGLPFSAKALQFEGVINSEMVWDEASRRYSFTIFSKLEDSEVGFTMEDGDFPYVPPSDRNKPWPLVFGQVCNKEAVQVTALRKGFLGEGVGVPDPTISERLCQANYLRCPVIKTADTTRGAGGTEWEDPETGQVGASLDGGGNTLGFSVEAESKNVKQGQTDQQCLDRRWNEICAILQERQQQNQYVKNPFTVRGGNNFPQNQRITIKINDVKFEGIMTGESFKVLNTIHPDSERINNPVCKEIKDASVGFRVKPGNPPSSVAECNDGGNEPFRKDVVDGAGASWRYYEMFEAGDFIWLPPGTDVFLADESDLLYIVSLIPGTVDQVAAYRTYGDTSLLTEVAPSRYTVNTTDYGGYEVVELSLEKPLSTIDPDEDWEDTLYVSFTSDVGPNPADIIEWLVDKYTPYTIDAASFASVKTDLTNYPTNFWLTSRMSTLALIRDIAFQARCAVYIRDNVVYLVYLSREPASLLTITESDILTQTFKFRHTRTEDLETRHLIEWSEGDAGVNKDDPTDFEFVLKHNIPKYGIFEASYNYYTLNIFELIEKSATFWMIRNANTWREVEFSTPAKFLNLDVFDCVTLDINAFPTTKIIITDATYNSSSNTITFKAWTPIRSGENTPYFWAWPSQKQANAKFPLLDAVGESGDGYDFSVIPPEGHPLRGGYDPDTAVLATDGDKQPSDLDDTLPTLECKIATGNEIADDLEPIIRIFEPIASSSFNERMDTAEAVSLDGFSANLEDKEDKGSCGSGSPDGGTCTYEVYINYITPNLITTTQSPQTGCKSAGPCQQSTNGRPCTGSQHKFCHTFGALFAATAFQSQKRQEAQNLLNNCLYVTGKTDVYTVGTINAIAADGPFGDCETVPSENEPGADAGQTAKPGLSSGNPNTAPDIGDL